MAEIRRSKRRRKLLLSQDLLDEILIRLPVKSIIRFESVCKTWRSNFHSRHFIDSYNRFRRRGDSSDPPFHAIKAKHLYKMAPRLANHDKHNRLISVVGPLSNSIYCLTTANFLYGPLTIKIALCNPATHQFKHLNPLSGEFSPLLTRITTKLYRIVCGFGTGAVGDYKVVVVINYGGNTDDCRRFVSFVYNGKWKRVPVGPAHKIKNITCPIEACPQRFFKGCWYWMTTRVQTAALSVLSFSFADDSFKVIGGPAVDVTAGHVADVLVLRDRLAVIDSSSEVVGHVASQRKFDVWMMMEYGVEESWTRVYSSSPSYLWVGFTRLYGINYCEDEESGGIRIERLIFLDANCWRMFDNSRGVEIGEIISVDDKGGHQVTNFCPRSNDVCFSMGGISTYVETLERL